ncbi:MAG: hypothetical protein K6U74_08060 [Firmicutes bacterium]|nr:hypothetical protein [Bacillota bacterium]
MAFSFLEHEGITIPESWRRLQKLTEKWGGVFMVIGGVSSGKSTFVKFLASSFLKRDKKIAIIDADIGQSWIGPPTTVSAVILSEKKKAWERKSREWRYSRSPNSTQPRPLLC